MVNEGTSNEDSLKAEKDIVRGGSIKWRSVRRKEPAYNSGCTGEFELKNVR